MRSRRMEREALTRTTSPGRANSLTAWAADSTSAISTTVLRPLWRGGGGDLAGAAADGKQLVEAGNGGAAADFEVGGAGAVAQFGHVAQDGDAAAEARQFAQGLQGGEHGVGVGVVTIVEDADAGGVAKLEAHFGRGASQEAAFDFGAAQAHFGADGKGEERVDDLVAAEEADAVFAGKAGVTAFDEEDGAVFVHADVAGDAIVVAFEAGEDGAGAGAAGDDFAPGVVAVEEENAVGGEGLGDGAFFAGDADEVVEEFEVFAADVGEDGRCAGRSFAGAAAIRRDDWCRPPARRPDAVAFQAQEGERHADVVVEAGFAPEGGLFLAQDGGDQFLGGGFAVGAADGDNGQVEVAAVGRAEAAEGAAGVVNENDWRSRPTPAGSLRRSATTAATPRRATSGRKSGRQSARRRGRKRDRPVRPGASRLRGGRPCDRAGRREVRLPSLRRQV